MYKLTAIFLTLTFILTALCGCENKKPKVKYTQYTNITEQRFSESYDYSSCADISLIDLTATVANGETAQLTIKAKPKTEYRIEVEYSSGISKSSSLKSKITDAKGYCTWMWRIGSNTKAGKVPIRIIEDDSIVLRTAILITKKQLAE